MEEKEEQQEQDWMKAFWPWDDEKEEVKMEEVKMEEDWANAFSNEKGENPFEQLVSVVNGIGEHLEHTWCRLGDENTDHADVEKLQRQDCSVESHENVVDEPEPQAEEPEPQVDSEVSQACTSLPLPLPIRGPPKEPFGGILDECQSPSRQILNKMLGMSTLTFSMNNFPVQPDVQDAQEPAPEPSPATRSILKRQRTVSFSTLPEIHHVESFKDMPELWDPAYMTPQPVSASSVEVI